MTKKHKDGKCDCWTTEPEPDWKDRKIAELEGSVITIKSCYENEVKEHDITKAKLDAVRPYIRHHFHCVWYEANCSDKCDCGLKLAIGGEEHE